MHLNVGATSHKIEEEEAVHQNKRRGDQCEAWALILSMDGALQFFLFLLYSKTDPSPMCARNTVGSANTPKE